MPNLLAMIEAVEERLELPGLSEVYFAEDGRTSMLTGVRAAIRGLYNEKLNTHSFLAAMESTVRRGLTRGYHEGAAACGIKANELSPDEVLELQNMIGVQFGHIRSLSSDILTARSGNGGTKDGMLERGTVWAKQYDTAYHAGMTSACADQKAVWELGATEKHCKSCLKLSGKVKRLSFWKLEVQPQGFPNSKLACRGAKCDCRLSITDLPISRGPLPSLP